MPSKIFLITYLTISINVGLPFDVHLGKKWVQIKNNGCRDRGYFLFSDHVWRFDFSQHIRFYPGMIRIPIFEASLLHFGSPDDQLFSGLLHFWTNFSENLPQNNKFFPKMPISENEFIFRKGTFGTYFWHFHHPLFSS